MADLAAENGDKELFDACKKLWNNITERKMYITGGIGSTVIGEAFTTDYDLPNDTAYAETCASIGLMFFASRMLENEVKNEYADVMERAFYNTVLAGMQLDGKRFFYVNPLECVPGISGCTATHWHTLTQRPGWYACACCPPNVARLISSFGKYAYGENEDTAYCHLFAAGKVEFNNGIKLTCETNYPYDFTVTYKIEKGGKIAVRIPGWSKEYTLTHNGNIVNGTENGYAFITVSDGDTIVLTLDSTPRYIYASPKIPELTGCTAVFRGPLVYCFEGADNGGDVLSLSLVRGGKITVSGKCRNLPDNIVSLTLPALRTLPSDSLYSYEPPVEQDCNATAIPYYAWCNRGENQMRVWMTEKR